MNLHKFLFCSLLALAPINTLYAAILSSEISGVVKSFDEKNVVLQQGSGTVNIPRKYFKQQALKSGEQVQLKLTKTEMESLFSQGPKSK